MIIEESCAGEGGGKEGFGEAIRKLMGYCCSLFAHRISQLVGKRVDDSRRKVERRRKNVETLQNAVATSTLVYLLSRISSSRPLAS